MSLSPLLSVSSDPRGRAGPRTTLIQVWEVSQCPTLSQLLPLGAHT